MNEYVRTIGRRMGTLTATTLIAGLTLTAATAWAQQKTTMPDAQVESNVLRQLATAPELSTQNIQSTTIYGTVTLSGNVQDEALRTQAENLVARAAGVQKVVDELTIGATPAADNQAAASNDADQPDGAYAPAQSDNEAQAQQYQGPPPPPQYSGQAEANNQPPPPPDNGAPDASGPPPNYGNLAPGEDQPAEAQPGYGPPAPPPHQPMYNNGYAPGPDNGSQYAGGQKAGLPVTVPSGTMLRVRINRGIDANHIKPGTPFDATVLNDVVSNGAVAIPRGAQVQGNVVSAKKAGALKGQAELALQLTSISLGGQVYPLATVAWSHEGRDKTITTVNRAVGLGVLGALFGAVAGGGAGAAIGAGIGGAAGVASSAGSPAGRVIVPPESVLTFHLAQPASVMTVSEQELSRLAYSVGPQRRPMRRRYQPYQQPYPY